MSMDAVILNPFMRRKNEAAKPANGPATARSNIEFQFFGGDFRGVIVPVSPSDIEGIRFGNPISN
jgi:hypothetical protein